MMKLEPSECGLMPLPGAWRAKKHSTEGTRASRTALTVAGKSSELVGSHRPRSCSTSVRHCGP